ncbi:MAG: lysophospholipid acyltransferase family protein [Bacilli bacterium]
MRAIYIYLLVIIHLIIVSPIVCFRYFYYIYLNKKKDYKKIYSMTNWVFYSVLKLSRIKYKVIGLENILNIDNGFLVVSNHQSYFDIPVISLALKELGVSFISKSSILKVPIISHYMQVMSCIFLKRDNIKSGLNMIKNGSKLLKNGVNLVIFPEGTRSENGKMNKFKAGSLKIATRGKSSIVPISISFSYNVNPSILKMRRGEIIVHIHKAITSKEYANMNGNDLNNLVEEVVKSKVRI